MSGNFDSTIDNQKAGGKYAGKCKATVDRKVKLTKQITETQFDHGYWYADEIRKFARAIGIPNSSKLRKDEIEKLITKSATTTEIKQQAITDGMITMAQDGILKALAGVTDIEEVFRVTEEQFMKIIWNKVTWYSKLAAVIVFLLVLILGIYIGRQYQQIQDVQGLIQK